jgi:hypothetical protein
MKGSRKECGGSYMRAWQAEAVSFARSVEAAVYEEQVYRRVLLQGGLYSFLAIEPIAARIDIHNGR